MLQRSREIRQRYLDAMGITLWVRPVVRDQQIEAVQARSHSPASEAVPEAVRPTPPADTRPLNETRQPESDAVAVKSPDTAPDTVADRAPSPGREAIPPATETLPKTSHGGIEFIQQWWAASGWLVVDTRPASISNTDQQNCDRLIGYIGHYLTGQARPEIAHYIDWPLFENPVIKHDMEEARVYLKQKWDSVARRMSLSGVLLLGQWSEQLLTGGLPGHDEAGSLTVVRGPGVSEMLNDVSAKRQLWQELQRV